MYDCLYSSSFSYNLGKFINALCRLVMLELLHQKLNWVCLSYSLESSRVLAVSSVFLLTLVSEHRFVKLNLCWNKTDFLFLHFSSFTSKVIEEVSTCLLGTQRLPRLVGLSKSIEMMLVCIHKLFYGKLILSCALFVNLQVLLTLSSSNVSSETFLFSKKSHQQCD